MAKPRRWAAISCSHCPFESKDAQRHLLQSLADAGDRYGTLTDFVMLGDLIEGAAGSVHPDEYEHTLFDEYEAAANYLEAIRAVLPDDCRLHWCLGNHDANLTVNDSRRTNKATRRLIHWDQSPWQDIFGRWQQYPYRKPTPNDTEGALLIGQCCFTHGWQAGVHSDQNESLQIAWALGGWSHLLFVRGHTHATRDVTQAMKNPTTPLPWYYCNAGTCGPLNPPYAHRLWTMWQPGLMWGECQDHHRQSRFPGKCWDAHLQLLGGGD